MIYKRPSAAALRLLRTVFFVSFLRRFSYIPFFLRNLCFFLQSVPVHRIHQFFCFLIDIFSNQDICPKAAGSSGHDREISAYTVSLGYIRDIVFFKQPCQGFSLLYTIDCFEIHHLKLILLFLFMEHIPS